MKKIISLSIAIWLSACGARRSEVGASETASSPGSPVPEAAPIDDNTTTTQTDKALSDNARTDTTTSTGRPLIEAELLSDPISSATDLSTGRITAKLLSFAESVSAALNDKETLPPPNNTYSHETAYGTEQLARPRIYLTPTESYAALASTDCSGWVDYVVNTVSPLHHAVLQSQKRRPEYNRTYEDGFHLKESERAWARAFVLTNYFRAEFSGVTGFERLLSHESVRAGDIGAYSLGRYIDPENSALVKPRNTGHVFIIAGPPVYIDPETPGFDGEGSLSENAVSVFALPIVDSSSVPHFDPDSRKDAEGKYQLPRRIPYKYSKSGGIGIGTAWFALDDNSRIIQRRLGPDDRYNDVIISAVRPRNVISLIPEILDEDGYLTVDVFDNTPISYNGDALGRMPITLTGEGGIRLVRGELILSGESNFTGGIVVESGRLTAVSEAALGFGDVSIQGGGLTLRQAAIADHATLRLSKRLQDGAVRLDFKGRDVIHKLQIGDKIFRCGTWGSFDSDAEFTDPRLSGPGLLFLNDDTGPECADER